MTFLRKVRRASYRAGSWLGWLEALTSGRPSRLIKRVVNVLIGRKVVRRLWWR